MLVVCQLHGRLHASAYFPHGHGMGIFASLHSLPYNRHDFAMHKISAKALPAAPRRHILQRAMTLSAGASRRFQADDCFRPMICCRHVDFDMGARSSICSRKLSSTMPRHRPLAHSLISHFMMSTHFKIRGPRREILAPTFMAANAKIGQLYHRPHAPSPDIH